MKKYYQPELTDEFINENTDFYSFYVFSNKNLAKKVFPKSKIQTYSGKDIENPTYVDYMYDSPLYHVKYEGLQKALRQKLGLPIKIHSTIKPFAFGKHKIQLNLSTINLANKTGIFKNFFENVEIGNHGGGTINENDIVWFNLYIYYNLINGGTNGINIADAWYNTKDKTWKIKFIDDIK